MGFSFNPIDWVSDAAGAVGDAASKVDIGKALYWGTGFGIAAESFKYGMKGIDEMTGNAQARRNNKKLLDQQAAQAADMLAQAKSKEEQDRAVSMSSAAMAARRQAQRMKSGSTYLTSGLGGGSGSLTKTPGSGKTALGA
jgi:hypothetical protein